MRLTPLFYFLDNAFRAIIFSIFRIKNKICARRMLGKSYELFNLTITIFLCFTCGGTNFLHQT